MSDIQFNLLNRRSAVSGYTPTGLKSGELFVQMADSQILFKNNLGETVKIGSFPSGDYVATGVTGSFVATSQTGKFATLDESNYLRSTEIPNITGDVCINAGSNISTVYKIQGQPVANTQPVIGQTLQYDGTSWVPGSVPAGGNGGGGLVYYFNDAVAADLPTGNLPASLSGTFELGRTGTANQLAITSNTLSQVSYDSIVGFVTDVLDPSVTSIPAGLFDFNIWASSSSISQTILQLKVFKYNGSSAPTLLATSDDVYTYDGAVTAQYIMSIVLPQTTLLSTDRLYIQLLAKATTANKTITLYFGGNTPSHVHTTIPSVGGSGLIKVINGIMQNPASKLVDADISETAAIAGSKIESGYFALANKTGLFLSSQVSGCSVILGGSSNFICTGLCNVVILGGNSLTGVASNTAYARDLCACGNVVSAGSIAASGSASICGSISIGTTVFNSLNSNLQINNVASNIINSSSSTSIGGPVHSISNSSNCSIIAGGCYHQITANSNGSAILGGANNTILCSTYSAAIGGQSNGVRASDKSITIGGCANTICCAQLSSILNGSGNFISGTSSTICNVSIIGCNITGTTSNTLYVNNICAFGGKYYGDGSALTGLATGSFITTSQTGAFGAAGYVTQESTGILVGTGQTGNFVTTSQTGVFALAAGTGSFITTGQTGAFGGSINTGSFVTTGQTGLFVTSGQTGNFFALSGSNVLITKNDAAKGVISAATSSTIVGGGSNSISNNTSVASIFGGCQNSISSLAANNTIVGGASNTANGSTSIIAGGFGNSVSAYTSNYGGVFAGMTNVADGYQAAIVGGALNTVNTCSCQSAVVSSCCSRVSGMRSVVLGGANNCITGLTNSVILGGQNIVANANNTAYANNFCSVNGKYYGDGSALTGLPTGDFVTTSQTGVFALAADTGNFVTTSQTGSFIVASQNNTFNTINASNLCVSGGYLSVGGIEENITVCSAAASGIINFDVCSSASIYYINNSTANFFINLRSDSSTALNSVLETNKTLTVTFLNTNGSTAYALTGVSIDGTGRSIKWLNGTGSYPAGNTGSIDSYSITAVKTGDNLYTVLGSQGKFV